MKSLVAAAELTLTLMLSLGLVLLPHADSEQKKMLSSNVVTDIVMDTDSVDLPCSYNGSTNCFWTHGTDTFRIWETKYYYNYLWRPGFNCSIQLTRRFYVVSGIWNCVFPDLYHTISYRVTVVLKPTDLLISYNQRNLMSDNTLLVNPSTNGEVRLECHVWHGIPGPEAMIWSVDGTDLDLTHEMEVTPYDRRSYVKAKSTLILKFDGFVHGNFTFRLPKTKTVSCRVRHRGYKDSPKNEKSTKTYNVVDEGIYPTNSVNLTHPKQAPFISDPIESDEMQPLVELKCEANGAPKPKEVIFYRLTDDNRTEKVGTFGWNDFPVEEAGKYWCEATNRLPNGTETTISSDLITVHRVIDPEHAKTAIENSGIILDCPLKSETDECIWLRKDITFFSERPNKQYPNHRVEKSGNSCNLVVKKVTQEDRGYWQCISKQGLQRNLVYFLRVRQDTI